MEIPVKTFFCPLTDEYGGEYPHAFVAIRACSESSQTTMIAHPGADEYDVDSEIEAITYKANYWYSEQTRIDGKRSRPLIYDENGTFTDEFTVDLDDPGVIQVLNSNMPHASKILHCIQVDLQKKFS